MKRFAWLILTRPLLCASAIAESYDYAQIWATFGASTSEDMMAAIDYAKKYVRGWDVSVERDNQRRHPTAGDVEEIWGIRVDDQSKYTGRFLSSHGILNIFSQKILYLSNISGG